MGVCEGGITSSPAPPASPSSTPSPCRIQGGEPGVRMIPSKPPALLALPLRSLSSAPWTSHGGAPPCCANSYMLSRRARKENSTILVRFAREQWRVAESMHRYMLGFDLRCTGRTLTSRKATSGSDYVACLHIIPLICHKTKMLRAHPSRSLPDSASLLAMAMTDLSRRLDWS